MSKSTNIFFATKKTGWQNKLKTTKIAARPAETKNIAPISFTKKMFKYSTHLEKKSINKKLHLKIKKHHQKQYLSTARNNYLLILFCDYQCSY